MSIVFVLESQTGKFPILNPKFPNRLPNQALIERHRFKSKSLRPIIEPSLPEKIKGMTIRNNSRNQHYTRTFEWKEEVIRCGFSFYSKNNLNILVTKDGEWLYLGQGSSYKNLTEERSNLFSLAKSLSKQNTLLNHRSENDHLLPKCLRKLVNVLTKESIAVNSAQLLNQLKENANSKTLARHILDYDGSSVTEGVSEILNTLEGAMWNKFYEKAEVSSDPEYKFLIDNNLDLIILEGYRENRVFAIAKMQKFTQMLQIPDRLNAAKVTFVLMRLVILLEKLPSIIEEKSNFNKVSKHLVPDYIVTAVENTIIDMQQVIETVEASLNLSFGARNNLKKLINDRINKVKKDCVVNCLKYITAWEQEPSFKNRNFELIKTKLYSPNFAFRLKELFVDSLEEFYNIPILQNLNIKNLDSKSNFEVFNTSRRFSDEVVINWNYDKYYYTYNPIKQSKGDLLAEKLSSVRKGHREAQKNNLKNINSKNEETVSVSHRITLNTIEKEAQNRLIAIGIELEEYYQMENTNISNLSNEKKFGIIFKKLEAEEQLINTILFDSDNKAQNNKISISLPGLSARVAAMKYANKSYASVFSNNQDLQAELKEDFFKISDNYAQALKILENEVQNAIYHAEESLEQPIADLEKIQFQVNTVDQFYTEMVDFLTINSINILNIDNISYNEVFLESSFGEKAYFENEIKNFENEIKNESEVESEIELQVEKDPFLNKIESESEIESQVKIDQHDGDEPFLAS